MKSMLCRTVADGAITGAKIAGGAVGAGNLAPGAVSANLASANLSTVAAGGLIGSADANNAALLAQGFVRDPLSIPAGEAWLAMPTGDAVAGHTVVWTGTELLVWGGVVYAANPNNPQQSYQAINRGARYNPSSGVWSPISMAGAPQARFAHTAVWTGTQMIIWGGQRWNTPDSPSVSTLNSGARYDPATDTWTQVSTTGAPSARSRHRSVWSGTEMLVWGGNSDGMSFTLNSGCRYNPATDTWSTISATGAPAARDRHVCLWTGSEMLIWGNASNGGRYKPSTNTWSAIATAPSGVPGNGPVGDGLVGIWSGSDMVLFYGDGNTASMASYSRRSIRTAGSRSRSPQDRSPRQGPFSFSIPTPTTSDPMPRTASMTHGRCGISASTIPNPHRQPIRMATVRTTDSSSLQDWCPCRQLPACTSISRPYPTKPNRNASSSNRHLPLANSPSGKAHP